MKTRFTIFVLFFSFAFCFEGFSQSYYYIQNLGTEPAYVYNTLGDTTNGWYSGMPDTLFKAKTIPFAWKFYNENVTSYRISDNGYITFDANESKGNPTNEALPSATAPKKAIFAFWDNLVLYKPDTYSYLVHTWTYGTSPNRVHVIAWFQASKEPAGSTSSRMTFAIRLFESGTKSFDVVFDNYYNAGTAAVTSGTIGCQNGDASLGTMVAGSPNYTFPTNITSATTDNVVFEFIWGIQTEYDITATTLSVPAFVMVGKSVNMTGQMRNLGSKAITSMKLNYSIDGGEPVSQVISSLNIPAGGFFTYNHPTPWVVPSNEKEYTIEVWASELNGNADGNTANDKITAKTTAISKLVPKKPLYEVFTSSTCPPCKPGNEQLDKVLNVYPDKWTVVKYQYDFPGTGDPYTTSEGKARGAFYGGINSVPRLEVDGGWNGNPGSYSNAIFDQFYAVPCFISINATAKINGQSVDVTGTFNSSAAISSNLNLYMAVVEKKTTKNVKSNGETEFHYVVKKMLPDANGVTVSPVAKGADVPFSQKYTFPGVYRLPKDGQPANYINLATEHSVEEFTDLTVVVWLQNTSTKEVYQSEFSTVINSVEDNTDNFMVNLYPNPVATSGKVRFYLDNPTLVFFEVVNSLGQRVFNSTPATMTSGQQVLDFDANTLLNGVYYMNLYLGDKVITRTFVK